MTSHDYQSALSAVLRAAGIAVETVQIDGRNGLAAELSCRHVLAVDILDDYPGPHAYADITDVLMSPLYNDYLTESVDYIPGADPGAVAADIVALCARYREVTP